MSIFVSLAVVFALVLDQTAPDGALSFEAASVKPSEMSVNRMYRATCQGGPGSRFRDQFICTDATVAIMAMAALDIQPYQLPGAKVDGGPRFEVRAIIPKGASREQVRTLFQELLKERFHIAYHFEKREMPVLELVKIGNGAKLRPSPTNAPPPEASGADGGAKKASVGPALSFGSYSLGTSVTGAICFEGNGVSLSELVSFLTRRLERKVTDSTGLMGNLEYSLCFKDDLAGGTGAAPVIDTRVLAGYEADAPDLATALKEQLGLKLLVGKTLLDVLIIDHIDKVPTPN